jgi:hypothetical protein
VPNRLPARKSVAENQEGYMTVTRAAPTRRELKQRTEGWLLLVMSLQGEHQALRMRVWRSLRALGTGVLRDGVYVLPARPELRAALQAQAEEIIASGGSARILQLAQQDNQTHHKDFQALFDRSAEYGELLKQIREARKLVKALDENDLNRRLNQLRRDLQAISAQDFFPGAAREQAQHALDDLSLAAIERLSPGEPHAAARRITRMRKADYQRRTWATRKRPWVDRLASAWLIRRFIDREARFKWLPKPEDCPARAVGFDFDGAAFTHVGAKVTFEVLLTSFGLETDAALERIGAIVHYLDVGGIAVPEAPGLAAILRGAFIQHKADDALLAEAERVFDLLYANASETPES